LRPKATTLPPVAAAAQSDALALPATLLCLPTAQSTQPSLPAASPYLPAAQSMQPDAESLPAALPYFPAAQAAQSSLPATSLYLPAAQSTHWPDSRELWRPARQLVHVPFTGTAPVGQATQLRLGSASLAGHDAAHDS